MKTRPRATRPVTPRDVALGRSYRLFNAWLIAWIVAGGWNYSILLTAFFLYTTPLDVNWPWYVIVLVYLPLALGLTLVIAMRYTMPILLLRKMGSHPLLSVPLGVLSIVPVLDNAVLFGISVALRRRFKAVGWKCGLFGASRAQLDEAARALGIESHTLNRKWQTSPSCMT
ncbi:MAG: hypothetical protein AAGD00_01810 [Planctomycetota bacterium]